MVLSKSDLSDSLTPFLSSEEEKNCIYKKKIVPIDYHAKFQIFKLSFSGSE